MNFSDLAISFFNDLAMKYGLLIMEKSKSEIHFESDKVRLRIMYDFQRSFEVNINLSLRARPNLLPIPLRDLVMYKEPNLIRDIGDFQSHDLSGVSEYFKEVINFLDNYCASFLRGEVAEFARIEEFRQLKAERYTKGKEFLLVKKKAQQHWDRKDFKAFLDSMLLVDKSYLSEIDQQKISYARKQVDGL